MAPVAPEEYGEKKGEPLHRGKELRMNEASVSADAWHDMSKKVDKANTKAFRTHASIA